MEARIHDQFCRCRECKPPLVGHSGVLRQARGAVRRLLSNFAATLFPR